MNKYLSQQIENEDDEYYQEEEIEVKPTRITRHPNNRSGGGSAPSAPAYRGPRFF